MRKVLSSLLVLVVSSAVVVFGAVGDAAATLTAPPPIPLTITGTGLAAMGGTSTSIGAAAATASSTGAGMTVTASTGTAVAGGAAGVGAGAVLAPAAVVVGGLAVGFGIGTFAGRVACAGGVDAVCWPSDADFVANTDVPPAADPQGWVPANPVPIVSAFGAKRNSVAVASGGSASVTMTPPLITFEQTANWTISFGVSLSAWGGGVLDGAITEGDFEAWCKNGVGVLAACVTGSQIVVKPSTAATKTLLMNSAGLKFDHARSRWCLAYTGATCSSWSGWFDWYPVGHVSRPETPNGNPSRTWLTRGQCVRGADVSFPSSSSVAFFDTDASIPKFPDVSCPAGFQLVRIEVHKITPTLDPPGNDVPVWEWDYPKQDWDRDPETPHNWPSEAFPECAGGACVMRLWQVQTDESLLDCFDAPNACEGWWAHRLDDPATYECRYGTHLLVLSECYVYRPTFDPIPTDAPAESPCQAAKVLGRPCYANPDGTLDAEPPVDPDPDPGDSTCPPKAGFLSFLNPFWLFSTLKCALVPTQAGLRAGWAHADVDWCSTAVGVLSCGLTAISGPLTHLGEDAPGPEDCDGGSVVVPVLDPRRLNDDTDDYEMHPWSVCKEPISTLSDLWLKLSTCLLYIGALLQGARMLAKTIGADDSVPS